MLRWSAIGLVLASCESAPRSLPESPAPTTSPHSRDQIAAATELQAAVAEGRLADVRDLAAVVEAIPELREPAWRVAHAGDLAAAGRELGGLGRACGGCHASAAVDVPTGADVAPVDDRTLAAQMRRHAWGMTRLWEGISGPDERAWTDGATVLHQTPCDVATAVHEKPNVEAFVLAERMRERASRAIDVDEPADRAALFGDLMATCAGCHRIMRPEPAIGARHEQVARSR